MTRYNLGPVEAFEIGKPAKASTACRDLVVVRRDDDVVVLDHDCQHLGAPLSEAIIEDGCLVCPWHRALISLDDGTLREPPGCRHHRRYPVEIEAGEIFIEIDPGEPSYRPVQNPGTARSDQTHPRSIVILGAGAAGMSAALTLAEEGFTGDVTIISDESNFTFDRTKLSKGLLSEPDEASFDALADLREDDLEYRHAKVRDLDTERRTLTFEDGTGLSADAFILAPGSRARTIDVQGSDKRGVLTLRSLDDARALANLADDIRKAVIVGSGFIGMEAAALLCGQDIDVEVVSKGEIPFSGLLGERLGRRLRREQEEAGIGFRTGSSIAEITGEDRVEGVRLNDGTEIEAGMVLFAIGAEPRTDLLPSSWLGDDGSVKVDAGLGVEGAPGFFAAGDIASVPTRFGPVRSEHWRWAQQLGIRAARSALGLDPREDIAPFFWTKQQAPSSFVYVGHARSYDDIIYQGDPDGGEFIAFYITNGRCTAIFALGFTDEVSRLERRMAREGPLPEEGLTE